MARGDEGTAGSEPRGVALPRGLRVGLAPGLSKTSWAPGEPVETSRVRSLSLPVARREVATAQVQLAADEAFVLVTDRANWGHPLGQLPRLRIELDAPGLPAEAVEVLSVADAVDDDGRRWPEILERTGYALVEDGVPTRLLIRVRVPVEGAPGEHRVTVRAWAQQGYGDEARAWEGELVLEVAGVTLPEPRDLALRLDLWQHLTAIARAHRVRLWSEDHLAIVDRYYAALAELGQKSLTLVVTEDPWSGWNGYRNREEPAYMLEHAVVGVRRTASKGVVLDFGVLDRLLALGARHGIDREIEVFGLLGVWTDEPFGFGPVIAGHPDAVRVRAWDERTASFTYLRTPDELAAFALALRDHLAGVGVLDRVRVAADEPPRARDVGRGVAFLRDVAPGFRFKLAMAQLPPGDSFPPDVTDISVGLVAATRDAAGLASLTAAAHAGGGRATFYLCCREVYPNTFVRSPLVEGELVGWLTHRLGLDGFLRWACCLWPRDPRDARAWRAGVHLWPAGDTYLLVAGPDGRPAATLRYEALRAAAQDFELLRLVEASLPPADARRVVEAAYARVFRGHLSLFAGVGSLAATPEHTEPPSVAPDDLYSGDPGDYIAARRVLLGALDPPAVAPRATRPPPGAVQGPQA